MHLLRVDGVAVTWGTDERRADILTGSSERWRRSITNGMELYVSNRPMRWGQPHPLDADAVDALGRERDRLIACYHTARAGQPEPEGTEL